MPFYSSTTDEAERLREKVAFTRRRARARFVAKILPTITYVKVSSPVYAHAGESTYQVFRANKSLGFVGLRRRESWRKHGRLRTSLIGLTRDWWSGSVSDPYSRDHTYSDYNSSRLRATELLLEHLYDLSHPEPTLD